MRAGIIVGPHGVERIVSVGTGMRATQDCLRLIELIWPDVEAFNLAIRARIPDGPEDGLGDAAHEALLIPS